MTATLHTITDSEFRRISHVVHQHCGINLHDGKQELVQARLAKVLRTSTFTSASDYIDHVLANPDSAEFSHLIDSLSTNLTSFFRESNHFDYLGAQFLPALFERKRKASDTRLRGWSSACSSGEEPYTIAMVLREAMEKAKVALEARILATDISHRVLATAKAGLYEKARIDPVPAALRSRYLRPATARPHMFEVTEHLRQLVRFAHLNLMNPWPFSGPFDFVFCRNVMIYFDKPTQQRLVQRFWDVLAPGGVLLTGHSESLTGITHSFKYVQATIYVKA